MFLANAFWTKNIKFNERSQSIIFGSKRFLIVLALDAYLHVSSVLVFYHIVRSIRHWKYKRFVASEIEIQNPDNLLVRCMNASIVLNSKLLFNTTKINRKILCLIVCIGNLLPSVQLTYANSPHCQFHFCLQNFTKHSILLFWSAKS